MAATDDVEIVGFVKPRHLRTPDLVNLTSDDDDDPVDMQGEAGASGSLADVKNEITIELSDSDSEAAPAPTASRWSVSTEDEAGPNRRQRGKGKGKGKGKTSRVRTCHEVSDDVGASSSQPEVETSAPEVSPPPSVDAVTSPEASAARSEDRRLSASAERWR
jgi:hypothetical protein